MIKKFKIFENIEDEHIDIDPYGEEEWDESKTVHIGDRYRLINIPDWWKGNMKIGDIVRVSNIYYTNNGEKRCQYKPITPQMWQMSDNSMKTFKESFEKINMNEAIKWYYKGKFEEEDDEKENDIFIRHGNIWPDILCVLKNKNKFGPTEELYIWRVDKRHDIFDEIPHCWGLYQKIGGVSKLATKEDIEKFLDADKLEAVNNY